MKNLVFSTGNKEKFKAASDVCRVYGIDLIQKELPILEIQSEDPAEIIKDKVMKAYELLQEPVIVSDDSWHFEGLNGFLGPYMKSINHWFRTEDFINLTRHLDNKRVYITMYLAFKNAKQVKLFHYRHGGYILDSPKGISGPPAVQITSLDGDRGLSIAEIYDQGQDNSVRDASQVWHDFVQYYSNLN